MGMAEGDTVFVRERVKGLVVGIPVVVILVLTERVKGCVVGIGVPDRVIVTDIV